MNDHGIRVGQGRSMAHGLLDVIGRAIVAGDYAGRPFPTEAQLAKRHGVSRSITREAVKMLAAKGLLGARPRCGTYVQPDETWNIVDGDVLRWLLESRASLGLLRHLNALRLAVESEAAALAARVATPAHIVAIDAALLRMRAAEAGLHDDRDAVIAFHVAILGAVGNPFYLQCHEIVATALAMARRLREPGGTPSLDDHVAVRDAIANRDADAARAAMRRLIGGA